MVFYLWNKLLGKLWVSKYQLQIFHLHNAVHNKRISLTDGDECGDQITNPGGVDEVQMIQSAQLVVIVKKDAVLV